MMQRAHTWLPAAGALTLAVVAGSISVLNPLIGLGTAIAVAGLTLAICYRTALPSVFLAVLGFCLFGYTFLGKGFAYFGVAPLFIGEFVLAFGVLAAILGGGIGPALRSPVSWLLLAFAAWGFVRTVPYVSTYGLDALRDATIWGYGAFALLVAGFVPRKRFWTNLPDTYARWFWWFAFWAPIAGVIFLVAEPRIPRVPGSGGIPALFVKAGDFGVQLAGVASFVLVGLADAHWGPRSRKRWLEWAWWTGWLGGVAITGAASRGALMSVFAALAVVVGLRPHTRLWKPILVALAFSIAFVGADIKIDTGQDRKVSAAQIAENLRSVVTGESRRGNLEGTRAWRLSWWRDIVNYTVNGPYFWTGKGFGINLADDDGYQGTVYNIPNRSPHNIQMTVLARAGVPGIVLWVLLQGTFAVSMLLAFFRARRDGDEWWARLNLWVFSFWLAFMVNASFDVFLEGPQGGIWFWSLMGFGIAALEAQRSLAYARQRTPSPIAMPAPAWNRSIAT